MANRFIVSKSTLSIVATTGVLLGLSACLTADQRTSNLSASDEEANLVLENRLKDSARVSAIVAKLDLALKPVANVLSDVEKILKADEKAAIRARVGELKKLSINLLREKLDRMKRGLVAKNADGNWEIDQTVNWPFDRDGRKAVSAMSCDASELALIGAPADAHSEEVSVVLADCMLPQPTALVRALVTDDLKVDAELNLGDLEQLLKAGAAKGTCSAKAMDDGVVLECAPFTETVNGVAFVFEKVEYSSSKLGETMNFSMSIVADGSRDNDWKAIRVSANKPLGKPMPLPTITRL